jgi:methionine-S-sulfoxide reductase
MKDETNAPASRLAIGAMLIAAAFVVMFGLSANSGNGGNEQTLAEVEALKPRVASGELDHATFGSGCFWCTESDFDKVAGVVATISGYMGGSKETANYQAVSSGRTKHVEVLHVVFDPKVVSYAQLLHHFWRTTDVVDGRGQFCDRGLHYRLIIFAHSAEQKQMALKDKAKLDASGILGAPIAVEIADAGAFTPAEDYHQNYYMTNPRRYYSYRAGCGRDQRIKSLWGSEAVTH